MGKGDKKGKKAKSEGVKPKPTDSILQADQQELQSSPPEEIPIDPALKALLRTQMYNYPVWTYEEEVHRTRGICYCLQNVAPPGNILVSFNRVLRMFMRNSQLPHYGINENNGMRRDQEACMMTWSMLECEIKNGQLTLPEDPFCEELLSLIEKAIYADQPISEWWIRRQIKCLRLVGCYISLVTRCSRRCIQLQVLSLASNWLEKLVGRFLPRSLKFLELFGNVLTDVSMLSNELPEWLLYLGLGRNNLSDDSGLHLLAENGNENLRVLDLADNYICDLKAVLQALKPLLHLVALELEGNPCWTCLSYREMVLKNIPTLQHLDNTEVWPVDRNAPEDCVLEDLTDTGSLVFCCYRIMGAPQFKPEKAQGKKVMQKYHLEMELPLLDPILRKPGPKVDPDKDKNKAVENNEEVANNTKGHKKEKDNKENVDDKKDNEDEKTIGKGKKKGTSSKKDKEKSETTGNDKKSKGKNEEKGSKGKKGAVLNAPPPDDEDVIPEGKRVISRFATDPQPWAKIMKFPEPTLEVVAPDNDLLALRDTFRSLVTVRLVYTRTIPPAKAKKSKKEKKSKKGGRESRTISIIALPPEDIILSRSTLATFRVPLQSFNWSEECLLFTWNAPEDNEQSGQDATVTIERLKELVYDEAGGKQKKGDKGKKKDKGPAKSQAEPIKLSIPSTLTIHCGFGLKRVQVPDLGIPNPVPQENLVPEGIPIPKSPPQQKRKSRIS